MRRVGSVGVSAKYKNETTLFYLFSGSTSQPHAHVIQHHISHLTQPLRHGRLRKSCSGTECNGTQRNISRVDEMSIFISKIFNNSNYYYYYFLLLLSKTSQHGGSHKNH